MRTFPCELDHLYRIGWLNSTSRHSTLHSFSGIFNVQFSHNICFALVLFLFNKITFNHTSNFCNYSSTVVLVLVYHAQCIAINFDYFFSVHSFFILIMMCYKFGERRDIDNLCDSQFWIRLESQPTFFFPLPNTLHEIRFDSRHSRNRSHSKANLLISRRFLLRPCLMCHCHYYASGSNHFNT